MKICYLSDIHLEFAKMKVLQVPQVDVIVLAGDIGPGMSGWRWAEKYFCDKPVVYVCGNHEFYSKKYSVNQLYAKMRTVEGSNVRLLQNNTIEIGDVVFVGGTWWTNFELNGQPDLDMLRAPTVMNDYNWIDANILNARITPEFIRQENWDTTNFMRTTIGKDPSKKYVAVTHHAPCNMSCDEVYRDNKDNVYYANTLDRDYEFPLPTLWIHGHMHNSVDYMMGDCRVVNNPRGYFGYGSGDNRKDFDSLRSVEI